MFHFNRYTTIIFLIAVLSISIVFLLIYHPQNKGEIKQDNSNLPVIASQSMFFDADNFQNAIDSTVDIEPQKNIKAIIVPQHLLASSLIAQQIKRASGRDIKNVVIIGPNHFNVGTQVVTSAKALWRTQYGNVSSGYTLTDKFITDLNLIDYPQVFVNEHSVGAVVPFVEYFLPDAKILPIIFSSYTTLPDVEKVSEWLADNLPDDSLVIYSIDFSHYLPREEADVKDTETRQYIENNDVAKIMTLGNDHFDSPASLATALLYAKDAHLSYNILAVKNSDDFSVERTPETTSYFIVTFK